MSHSPTSHSLAADWQDDATWKRRMPQGFCVEATANPDSPVLDRFFSGYDLAFVLPDEREEIAGFRECLALNQACRHVFGRTHCELVVTISEDSGTLVGGANFLATALAERPGNPRAAIALNYVFVETAARGRGLLRRIVSAVRSLALESVSLPPDATAAVFIEQNDPLRLSDEDYRRDSAHSGLDQVDRLAIWARLGTRLVDFPYVQPALSASQKADGGLVYAAVGYPGNVLPAWLLHDHLESFFGISVLKGRRPADDPVAAQQLKALRARDEAIGLLAVEPALAALRGDPARAREHASLRELAVSLA